MRERNEGTRSLTTVKKCPVTGFAYPFINPVWLIDRILNLKIDEFPPIIVSIITSINGMRMWAFYNYYYLGVAH